MLLARPHLRPHEPIADLGAPTLCAYAGLRRLGAAPAAEAWHGDGASPPLLSTMLLARRVDARLAAPITPANK